MPSRPMAMAVEFLDAVNVLLNVTYSVFVTGIFNTGTESPYKASAKSRLSLMSGDVFLSRTDNTYFSPFSIDWLNLVLFKMVGPAL